MASFLNNLLAKIYSSTTSRYVNTFVPINRDLESGKKDLNEDEQHVYEMLKDAVSNLEKIIENHPVVKEVNEILYMRVLDKENLVFTVIVKDGKGEVILGYDGDVEPSYIIPLYSYNIEHLKQISSDGELDLSDIYRMARVLFIPFLQGLYNGDYSQLPRDKAYMQLDNFIHVEVKGPEDVEVEGFEGPARATVVNVDGQWLMFEGFQGDPDIKYEMDMQQALKFAYLISVKIIGGAKEGKSLSQLKKHIDEYNELKEEVQVYERDWHNVSEYKK